MEPMTVILGALSAVGAAIGDQGVKDAYAGLKALIVQKFGVDNPKLEQRLDEYVEDADTFAKPAEKALRDAKVDQDQDVVNRAVEVMKQAEAASPGASGGLVGQINAAGGVVNVVGGNVYGGINVGMPPRRDP